MRQSSLIAHAAKPIAKASGSKRLAELGDKEGHVGSRQRRERAFKLGMNRYCERGRSLLLSDHDAPIFRMLPTEADDIATPLPRVERERHGESGARAERMLRLELSDLVLAPGVITLRIVTAIRLHAERRVNSKQTDRNGMAEHRTQHLQ